MAIAERMPGKTNKQNFRQEEISKSLRELAKPHTCSGTELAGPLGFALMGFEQADLMIVISLSCRPSMSLPGNL
jgi:hypothetical protein